MTANVITLEVEVVDGGCHEVPYLEVGARFAYKSRPSTWSRATADCGGIARFCDEHSESPTEVTFFIENESFGTFRVEDGASYVLEA